MQAVFFKAMYWPLGNCSRANSRYSHCFCIHSSRIISIVQKISFSQARTKLYILFRTERSKTILCLAAHARRGHIREYFPPRRNTCRKGLLTLAVGLGQWHQGHVNATLQTIQILYTPLVNITFVLHSFRLPLECTCLHVHSVSQTCQRPCFACCFAPCTFSRSATVVYAGICRDDYGIDEQ